MKTATKNVHQWTIILGIVIILALPLFQTQHSVRGVIKGDIAEIRYTITLENGSVYATTNSELAAQYHLPVFIHDSLRYVVAQNNPYPLDEVIQGMLPGQKKTKTYAPTYLPSTQTLPRTKQTNRILSVPQITTLPLAQFSELFGSASISDQVQNQDYFPWVYIVLNISDTNVHIQSLATPNQVYNLPGQPWPAYLTDISGKTMYFRQDAEIGQHLTTYLGDTEVTNVSEKKITVKRNSEPGMFIETEKGNYVVVDVTEKEILIRPARTLLEETNFTIVVELLNFQKTGNKKTT